MHFNKAIFGSLFAINLILCQTCQSQDVWPQMQPPGAVEDLPQELKTLAPFNINSILPAKAGQKREQHYLQTLILLNYSYFNDPPQKWFLDSRAAQAFVSDVRIKKKRKQVVRDLEKIESFKRKSKSWKPRRNQYVIDKKIKPRFSRIVKNFSWVFDELESAQKKHDACQFPLVFTRDFGRYDSIASQVNLNYLQDIVETLYAAEPLEQTPHPKVCKTYLALLHDLPAHSSEDYYRNEIFVFENLLPLTLSSSKNVLEVDELIEFFRILIQNSVSIDTTLEHAKWQFLCTAMAYIDLRDKDYRDVMKNHSPWDENMAILALRQNAFGDSSWSQTDIEAMERRLEKKYKSSFSDSQQKQMKSVIEKYREAGRDSRIEDQFFCTVINGMKRVDFERELKIHQQRYREIQAACGKPAAERGKDLRRLNDLWTIDPAWTESPLLKFVNCNQINDYELKRRFYRRASLCLAVVKKWRIKHDGKPPASLKVAFEFADAGEVPNDPYDGKQLRMMNSKVTTSIYSVGPDLKDNKMMSLKKSGNPPKGDLVLSVEFTD